MRFWDHFTHEHANNIFIDTYLDFSTLLKKSCVTLYNKISIFNKTIKQWKYLLSFISQIEW